MKRNRDGKRIVSIFVLLILLWFVVTVIPSCATTRGNIGTIHTIKKSIADDIVSLNIEYLPEKRLKELFGNINNPFLSPVSFLKSNRLMVFHLYVTNKSDRAILMHLKRLELQFGGVNANPYNRFQLYNFWEPRIERQSEYKRWNKGVLRSFINKNVFDNNTIIESGKNESGYIVFKGAFPQYGRAVVYLPFYDEAGRLIKRYELVFEF